MSDKREVLLSEVLLPLISGGRPAGGASSSAVGVPSIGGENILIEGGMTYQELKRIPYVFFKNMSKGWVQIQDVLMNKDGAQTGKVGLYEGEFERAAINEHVFILRARDQKKLNQHYLYYCLLYSDIRNKIERRITGSAQPGLNSQFIKAVSIPIFSIEKQKKIAFILESVDADITKTKALIEKYRMVKLGLVEDLLSRGILPSGELRKRHSEEPSLYKETDIGWMPKEWAFCTIEDCLTSSPKNGYSPREADGWEGAYVLGLACLTREGFKGKQLKNAPQLSALAHKAILSDGDFLISRANTPDLVGLCGIYNDVGSKAIYPDLMMRLSLSSHVVGEFLEMQLLHPRTRTRLTALAVGTSSSMAKLNSSSLKKFNIFLPSVDEQRLIIEKNQVIASVISRLEKSADKLKIKKLGLMQDLLTGKVEVKVNESQDAKA